MKLNLEYWWDQLIPRGIALDDVIEMGGKDDECLYDPDYYIYLSFFL